MLLQLSHVYKIYGELHAVDDLSLDVEKGEWLAIVGSSGSGKTTLMNIIGCMDTPTKGTVTLDGRELGRLNASQLTDIRKNVIGLVFQQFHLIAHLTAVENVMVAQYYHSMTDQKEAMEALENVGLGDRAHHLPSQLSGGEQQRVCIARALINHPEIILADEPTGNLDETNEQLVLDIFHRLHRQGTTLIVVTHDAHVASNAQREILLNHGRLVGERTNEASESRRERNMLDFGGDTSARQGTVTRADGEREEHEYDLIKERLNPKLEIEGVVFTMYDARTNLSLQVVENVKENLDKNIYKTIIPRNVRLAEAPSYGMPINMYDSRSAGAEAYRYLAEEVIEKEDENEWL